MGETLCAGFLLSAANTQEQEIEIGWFGNQQEQP